MFRLPCTCALYAIQAAYTFDSVVCRAYVALEAARHREQTEEFAQLYAKRAGIEGTHAKASTSDGIASVALYWGATYAPPACSNCYGH
jgi:hypothetical protein